MTSTQVQSGVWALTRESAVAALQLYFEPLVWVAGWVSKRGPLFREYLRLFLGWERLKWGRVYLGLYAIVLRRLDRRVGLGGFALGEVSQDGLLDLIELDDLRGNPRILKLLRHHVKLAEGRDSWVLRRERLELQREYLTLKTLRRDLEWRRADRKSNGSESARAVLEQEFAELVEREFNWDKRSEKCKVKEDFAELTQTVDEREASLESLLDQESRELTVRRVLLEERQCLSPLQPRGGGDLEGTRAELAGLESLLADLNRARHAYLELKIRTLLDRRRSQRGLRDKTQRAAGLKDL